MSASRTIKPPGPETHVCVKGARTNNLQNVDVTIPRDGFVVITGVSGSGKSSLAFETVYAEGQRQYIDSLALRSRQFLHQLPAPEVDRIDGIPPTVCLDQTRQRTSQRSTVGTASEIYDYFRLLMARSGAIHCYGCGRAIEQQSPLEIRDQLLRLPEGTKVMILAPLEIAAGDQLAARLTVVRREGLVRARINGELHDIDRPPLVGIEQPLQVEAITDRIIIRDGVAPRLLEAIENATRISPVDQVIVSWLPATSAGDSAAWSEKKFSTRYACPDCGIQYQEIQPRSFSFNSPFGACPSCHGLGEFTQFHPASALDPSRSLADGAVRPWRSLAAAATGRQLGALGPCLKELGLTVDANLEQCDRSLVEQLFAQGDKRAPGIAMLLEKELATTLDEERQRELEAWRRIRTCNACQGTRVSPMARAVFLGDRHIGQWASLPVDELIPALQALSLTGTARLAAERVVPKILNRLEFLRKIGVGYLTLNRGTSTLSGGEQQRVRLAAAIGSGVSSACFVLDEPSIGLHPRDTGRLIETLRELQHRGNSLIVVEHDVAVIEQADHVIDMGPGAGEFGGRVVSAGSPSELAADRNSVTGKYLFQPPPKLPAIPRRQSDPGRQILLRGAAGHNLRQLDVAFPLDLFCCVTGVSGSGKSTLVHQTLARGIREHWDLVTPEPASFDSLTGLDQLQHLAIVNQQPIGRTPRGCPATYCGLLDPIRKLFAATREAKRLGFGIGRFSFNSKSGWCPECRGLGYRTIEMKMMPTAFVPCEGCRGSRFNRQTLQVRFGDYHIGEVLALSIRQALDVFDGFHQIRVTLQVLQDVGLGYLRLGQPANTLSGGESQRVKLAFELSRPNPGHGLYLLDEPTSGLHAADVQQLIAILQQLVDRGNSLLVVEHNLDVIRSADWVIDLGPEGGPRGGQVVFQGPPAALAQCPDSLTGRWLREDPTARK